MKNKSLLDLGSIISDINLGTASKIGRSLQDKMPSLGEDEMHVPQTNEYEDRGPIGDYEVTYQELRRLLDNIKQKWETDNSKVDLFNTYYQRDLLYLYDRIALDMDYLNGYPERNNDWLEKLLELKYEIRNLL